MKKSKKHKPLKTDGKQRQEMVGQILEADEENTPELRTKLKGYDKSELIEIAMSVRETVYHSGPLPPASELEEYERICPGASERIIRMAEAEQEFRHTEISKSEARTFADRKSGYFLGAVLLALLIGGAITCLYIDKEQYAALFLGTAVLSVIGKFIPGAIRIIKGRSESD